MYFYKILLIYK